MSEAATRTSLPPAVRLKARADMRASVWEGLFSQAFLNLAGPWSVFVTALALSLGAEGLALGLLFAAGPVVQGAQLLGPAFLSVFGGSRRRTALAAGAVSRVVVILMPLWPLVLPARAALWAVIGCFLLSQVFYGVYTNIWTSWIGATVPDRVRGRFLGRRTQYITFAGLAVAFAASIFKDVASPGEDAGLAGFFRRALGLASGVWAEGGARYAFIIIFGGAAAIGVVATLLLSRQRDRPAPTARFSFRALGEPLRDGRFRRLTYFFGWWFFAISFGSPFWQPFFLNELGMSLTSVQLYGTISVVGTALTAALAGRAIDRFGNKPVFRGLMFLSVVNAGVYLFMSRDNHWWIWLEAFSSGAMWGGAIIAAMNLIIRLSPTATRDNYVAVYAVAAGAGGLLGAVGSGQLVGMLPHHVTAAGVTLVNMQVAFLGTACLRLLAQIPMSLVAEPRAVPFAEMMRALAGDARLWLARSRYSLGK
jgi:hypothetical protein